jgi:tetratricopeptide (TPR) repeat protein
MATDTNNSNILTVIAGQQNLRSSAANTALSNGVTLMEKKKYAEAARAFKQAAAYDPTMANAYTFMGDAYTRLGKKSEAAAAYELSLKVDRTQDTVYSSLANVYLSQNRTTDAEKVLKKAVQRNNQNTPAFYTLGQLMAQRGDYKDAETQFRRVISLEPKDGNGHYALGMALNGQGKSRDAIAPLEKAIKLKKNFEAAYLELGEVYIKMGDTDKAQEQVDKLNNIQTSFASVSSAKLTNEMQKPGIYYYDSAKSSLQLSLNAMDLTSLDPATFATPDASKDVSVSFVFDSEMDPASITKTTNWSISKATGGTAGIYNNGLTYSPQNVPVPAIPKVVTYDPDTREATLVFTVAQNSTGDGKIDPSHLVFRFKGTDSRGMTMDPTADQYDGFKNAVF